MLSNELYRKFDDSRQDTRQSKSFTEMTSCWSVNWSWLKSLGRVIPQEGIKPLCSWRRMPIFSFIFRSSIWLGWIGIWYDLIASVIESVRECFRKSHKDSGTMLDMFSMNAICSVSSWPNSLVSNRDPLQHVNLLSATSRLAVQWKLRWYWRSMLIIYSIRILQKRTDVGTCRVFRYR